MAELFTSKYGLVEQAKRLDANGDLAQIVECLNREMGMILQEAPWLMSNDVWVNKTTRRASLNAGTKRALNQRITASVSRTTEIMDTIINIEDYCEPDAMYIDSMPNIDIARAQEIDAFVEGMGQTLVSEIIYGADEADSMYGIEARLATVDGRFVIDGGGTGSDLTSILVVNWSPTMAHLIYPKNMEGFGIQHDDKGRVTSETSDGKMEVYRDHFKVRCGFVVRHPRAIGRLANIEVSGTDNTFDENDLIALTNNVKRGAGSRIYVNDTMITQMQIRSKDQSNRFFTQGGDMAGAPPLYFNRIPIRVIDREILVNTEDAIS